MNLKPAMGQDVLHRCPDPARRLSDCPRHRPAALQIGVGLAFLGRGLTAPHGAMLRALLVGAGLAVIFLRFDMLVA